MTTRMRFIDASLPLSCDQLTRRRTRDAEGHRLGSHPAGCKFSQDDDGTLHVTNARGDQICQYPPAQYEMHDAGDMIHVHKTGEHDSSRFEREPTRDRAPRPYVGPGAPPPPAQTAGLRQMNKIGDALRAKWSADHAG